MSTGAERTGEGPVLDGLAHVGAEAVAAEGVQAGQRAGLAHFLAIDTALNVARQESLNSLRQQSKHLLPDAGSCWWGRSPAIGQRRVLWRRGACWAQKGQGKDQSLTVWRT